MRSYPIRLAGENDAWMEILLDVEVDREVRWEEDYLQDRQKMGDQD